MGGALGAEVGAEEDGEPEAFVFGGGPDAAQAAAAFGLGFGEDDDALADAVAGEFFDDVVGGGGLLKYADVAADDGDAAESGEEVVGVQGVGAADEAVAAVGAGFDVVADLPEFFDAGPDGGAADVQLLGELGTGDAIGMGSEGEQDFGVGRHSLFSNRGLG